MRRLATIIRETGKFPFETENDVVRWCLHHGLEKLGEIAEDDEVTSSWKTIHSWVETAGEMMAAMKYEKEQKKILDTLEALIANGHSAKAEELAEQVWKNADWIDDPYWLRMYRDGAKKILDRIRRRAKAEVPENSGNGHRR
jgi:hypothetical protein